MNEKISEQLDAVTNIEELRDIRRAFLDNARKREKQIYNGMTFRQRMIYPNQKMRLALLVMLLAFFLWAAMMLDSGAFGEVIASGPILSPPDNVADLIATDSFAIASSYISYAAPVAFMIAGFAFGVELVYGMTAFFAFLGLDRDERGAI